jgi:hypothetical protein
MKINVVRHMTKCSVAVRYMPTVRSNLQRNTHTHKYYSTLNMGGGAKIPSKYLQNDTAASAIVTAVRILHFK